MMTSSSIRTIIIAPVEIPHILQKPKEDSRTLLKNMKMPTHSSNRPMKKYFPFLVIIHTSHKNKYNVTQKKMISNRLMIFMANGNAFCIVALDGSFL